MFGTWAADARAALGDDKASMRLVDDVEASVDRFLSRKKAKYRKIDALNRALFGGVWESRAR